VEQSRKKIFISYVTDERMEAEQAKEFLTKTFGKKVEVFLSSSWESIQPGEDWYKKINEALASADLILVLSSPISISQPWILFEAGAAWVSKKRVIPVCHNGMIPNALPDPLKRLQAIDINAPNPAESLSKLVEAVRVALDLPKPSAIPFQDLPVEAMGTTSVRGWMLRPSAHIGESIEGFFKVGFVDVCDPSRAKEAEIDPDQSIYTRLFVESGISGLSYLNVMVTGKAAELFERGDIIGKTITGKLTLKTTYSTVNTLGVPQLVPVILLNSAKLTATK
jgi:hypothetical protein